jgi:hypothetical protein
MRRRSFASKGRFGEAEPEGCTSIREKQRTQRGEGVEEVEGVAV